MSWHVARHADWVTLANLAASAPEPPDMCGEGDANIFGDIGGIKFGTPEPPSIFCACDSEDNMFGGCGCVAFGIACEGSTLSADECSGNSADISGDAGPDQDTADLGIMFADLMPVGHTAGLGRQEVDAWPRLWRVGGQTPSPA